MKVPNSMLVAAALLVGCGGGAALAPAFNSGVAFAGPNIQTGTCSMTPPSSTSNPSTCTAQLSSPATSCIVQRQVLAPLQRVNDAYNCIVSGTTVTVNLDTTNGFNNTNNFAFIAF